LLAQAGQGEVGAIGRLLEAHRGPLRRLIDLRLDPALAGRVDASDIVQEVMLEVSQRLDEYLRHPTMPFRLWLRHIARDHLIDAYRHHRQAQRRSLDREQLILPSALEDPSSRGLEEPFIDKGITPASAAVRQDLQRLLEQALAQLAEDDRVIIRLRHYEQRSNQEVAAALGLSEAAASMRHLRAVRRLRGILLGK
jgi:RNA polymerase sigma-70 factor (ECF subfamily)